LSQVDGSGAVELVVAEQPTREASREFGELFVEANAAYESGEYAAAIERYQELIERGAANGQVHFNLGNAFLRNGELGRAIAQLRRARNLQPRNEDIRANLAFARDSTKDAIAPPEPSPLIATLFFWHYRMSLSELAGLAVFLSVVFWSLAGLSLIRRESEILSWVLIAVLVVYLGTLTSMGAHRFFSQQVAVVVPQEINVFTAPDVESVVRFKLHAGTELRIKDEREGWVRIVLPDQQQGWVEVAWIDRVDG
jgi:hypothetical protein